MLIFEAQIEEGGVIHLPDAIIAQIRVGATVRVSLALPEDHILTDEDIAAMSYEELFNEGDTLPIEEILKSPAIGMWADREDMADSVEYVRQLRDKRRQSY